MHSSEDCLARRSEAHHLGRRVAAVTKDSSSSSTVFEAEDVERTCLNNFSLFWPSWASGVEGRGVPGAGAGALGRVGARDPHARAELLFRGWVHEAHVVLVADPEELL